MFEDEDLGLGLVALLGNELKLLVDPAIFFKDEHEGGAVVFLFEGDLTLSETLFVLETADDFLVEHDELFELLVFLFETVDLGLLVLYFVLEYYYLGLVILNVLISH